MPNPLIIGAGLSLGSGIAQSSAANKAADAQTQAASQQIAESRRQFDIIRGLLKPYVDAGGPAMQQQMALLGLAGQVSGAAPQIETVAGTPGGQGGPAGMFGGRHGPERGRGAMDFLPGLSGPRAGAFSPTRYRVNGQMFDTMDAAQAYAESQRTTGFDQAKANQAQADAISALQNGSQFRALVQQGEEGILASAAATGGLRGGDTQGALAQYRPQMLQALIDKQLAALGGIAANSQNAAAGVGSAAQGMAGQINASLGEAGAAKAGAYLAGGKAIGDTLSGFGGLMGNFYGQQGIPQGAGLFSKWGF